MGVAEAIAIFAAGTSAGVINAVVGSGSLITFPTLLAFGFPPVVANVSNNIGLVPGNASAAWGYRRELSGQRGRLIRLSLFSALGSLAGAVALLALPAGAFKLIVPALILLACVLVLVQPRLSARIAARRERRGADGADASARPGAVLCAGVLGAGAYGGYFGAAQGVLLMGLLGTFIDENMQRINGAKNVLAGIANATAAIVYIFFAPHISWVAVLLIAVSSTIGGLVGARIGRRLPPTVLRIFIVVIGVVAILKLIFF
ncbi:MAG: sulfite exporter TauE/SafE family protein [Streptosporangiaceae bacterium]